MALAVYMDHNIHGVLTESLQVRGIDVLTSAADQTSRFPDATIIERATSLGRVLVSHDADMLVLVAAMQRDGRLFSGLIYVHSLSISIGQMIEDVELLCLALDPQETVNNTYFVPLR